MAVKLCTKCSVEKDASEFGKNATRPDGLSVYCKQCKRNDQNSYNAQDRDKSREHVRNYRESHKEDISARMKKWRKDNRPRLLEYERQYKKENNK